MELLVNLEPEIEASLRKRARERSLYFDRALNDVVRAGLESGTNNMPCPWPTYSLGSDSVDLTKALALAGEMEDREITGKMRLAEQR